MAFVIIEDTVITLTFKALATKALTGFSYAIPTVDYSLHARWLATTIKSDGVCYI